MVPNDKYVTDGYWQKFDLSLVFDSNLAYGDLVVVKSEGIALVVLVRKQIESLIDIVYDVTCI